jgi:hypothetical protein
MEVARVSNSVNHEVYLAPPGGSTDAGQASGNITRRTLKFRAWDKLEKRMITDEAQQQQHYTLSLSGRFFNLQNGSGGDEYEVTQFTGYHDSRGEEIYEGDTVQDEKGKTGTVRMETSLGRWVALGPLTHSSATLLRIVGNIYQQAR